MLVFVQLCQKHFSVVTEMDFKKIKAHELLRVLGPMASALPTLPSRCSRKAVHHSLSPNEHANSPDYAYK